MRLFFQYTAAFIAAVVLAALLSSIASTQFVIAALQSINVEIPLATRASMTIKDLAILQTLLMAIAGCFLVGFLVAGACVKYIGGRRHLWYVVAGMSALVCLLLLMSMIFQLMPIAGARSNFGLFAQAIAGGFGGWLFAVLTSRKED